MNFANRSFPRYIVVCYRVGRLHIRACQTEDTKIFDFLPLAFFFTIRGGNYDGDPTERAECVLALSDANNRQLAEKFLAVSEIFDAVVQGL